MMSIMEYTFYTIQCKTNNSLVYVGSTTNFNRRTIEHKTDCSNVNSKRYNLRVYSTIRANGGFDNFEICVIDTIICTKEQARVFETGYMDMYGATLNSINAFTDRKEYETQNKKQYHIDNRDAILAKKKQHYIENRDAILVKKKQYRVENRDAIQAYRKAYAAKKKQDLP